MRYSVTEYIGFEPMHEKQFDDVIEAKRYAYERDNENKIVVIYDKEKGETVRWN